MSAKWYRYVDGNGRLWTMQAGGSAAQAKRRIAADGGTLLAGPCRTEQDAMVASAMEYVRGLEAGEAVARMYEQRGLDRVLDAVLAA